MKNSIHIAAFLLTLGLLGQAALAADPEVSSTLRILGVAQVGTEGRVLHSRSLSQTRQDVIGIPVTVELGDACTQYAGQQDTQLSGVAPRSLQAIGASNPLADACIAVVPQPIKTQFTLIFDVPNELPVAVLTQRVQIGQGVYNVTYELTSQKITIAPVNR